MNLTLHFTVFPSAQILSIPQIYRIGTMFLDDKYGTHGLSPEVRNLSKFSLVYSTESKETSIL